MLRKNKGSILIVTVFVFLLVNIIAISCSALILSNNKYTKYNYEEIYIKEQCLSKIELIYSNILNEVKIALNQSSDFDSFQTYFTDNNSSDFINRISDISGVYLKDTRCNINRVDIDDETNSIYYSIISEVKDQSFKKTMVAYIKIENPFDKNQIEKNEEIDKVEDNGQKNQEEINKDKKDINPSDLVTLLDCKEE